MVIRFMVNALVGLGVLGVNPSVSPCVVKKESLVDVGGKVAMLVYIAHWSRCFTLIHPKRGGTYTSSYRGAREKVVPQSPTLPSLLRSTKGVSGY